VVTMIQQQCPQGSTTAGPTTQPPPPSGGVDVLFVISTGFDLSGVQMQMWTNARAIAQNINLPVGQTVRIGIIYFGGNNQPNQFVTASVLSLAAGANKATVLSTFDGIISAQQWNGWFGIEDINTGLVTAQTQYGMYPLPTSKKYIVLLTSGTYQKPTTVGQCCIDPTLVAGSLRNNGVTLLGYGVGAQANIPALTALTGGAANVYNATTFANIATRISAKT